MQQPGLRDQRPAELGLRGPPGDGAQPRPALAGQLDADMAALDGPHRGDAHVGQGEQRLGISRSEGLQALEVGPEGAVAGAEGTLQALLEAKAGGPRSDGLVAGSWQSSVADAVHSGRIKIGFGDQKTKEKILHKLANPDFAVYKIQQTAYKFAFLLIPLSIPFVGLLFLWKRGFTWYDHGVFVLYSLTFMSILTMIIGIFGRWDGWFTDLLAFVLMLSVPVHMFAQLKGTYGLSIWSATWRTFLLLNFCTITIGLFVLAIILMGLTG